MVVLSIFIIHNKHFSALNFTFLAPRGPDTLIHSLPVKNRKWFVCELVLLLFATHAGLLHDIADTNDSWAKNGSTHGHVFCDFQILILTQTGPNIMPTA